MYKDRNLSRNIARNKKNITTLVLPSAKQEIVDKTKSEAKRRAPGNTLILAEKEQTAVTRDPTRVQRVSLIPLKI